MANLDTFYCARCGYEFVVKPEAQWPVCPACGAELKRPARPQAAPTAGEGAETGQAAPVL